MYAERLPIYKAVSKKTVVNDSTVEIAASRVLEDFNALVFFCEKEN